jgi:hypothetical protein
MGIRLDPNLGWPSLGGGCGFRGFLRYGNPVRLWLDGALDHTPTHCALLPVSVGAFVKTWLPFVLFLGIILTVSLVFNLR